MRDGDFWTNIVLAVSMIIVATLPALLAQGLNGYVALLIVGPLGMLLLTWLEEKRT